MKQVAATLELEYGQQIRPFASYDELIAKQAMFGVGFNNSVSGQSFKQFLNTSTIRIYYNQSFIDM